MYRLNFPGRALISSPVGQIEDDVRLTVALVFLALWIPVVSLIAVNVGSHKRLFAVSSILAAVVNG